MSGQISSIGRGHWRAGLGVAVALGLSTLGTSTMARAESCASVGITLSPGFCATIFADNIGHVRHMAVGPDGVLYVNSWSGPYYRNGALESGGFLVALKDSKGSGHADVIRRFGEPEALGAKGGTGIAIYEDGLFAEEGDKILRYRFEPGDMVPQGPPQVVLSGLPLTGDHPMHPFVISAGGDLYVDLGSATNSCQALNRIPGSPGQQLCTELETRGGIWRYDANKTGQLFSPKGRFVTGLRNGEGLAFDVAGRLFDTQHGRDQLYENWPHLYTPLQGHELPAEEVVELTKGADFGWPECYFDGFQKKLVLAPEYGGDGGKTVGICAEKKEPIAFFPAHWAPNDMLIYTGKAFPAPYQGGAFIAFHGSWNRAPAPQGGYNVVFQPMADGKASGAFIVFADGFAGAVKEPGTGAFRPTGLAMGKDGALFISDDMHGRIWRVTYQGPADVKTIAPAPALESSATTAQNVLPPEGIHPNAGRDNGASLPVPPGATKEEVTDGDDIFHGASGGTCSGCHASDAKGTSVGPDLTMKKWIWGDGSLASIRDIVIKGVPKPKIFSGAMPPKGGAPLTDKQVEDVADYVWAISHSSKQ
ncbi:MAG: c-type cytochrome [Methylovirgula sp.]|jgi:glucose/arabinose dehydrogenase/cytochrome c5